MPNRTESRMNNILKILQLFIETDNEVKFNRKTRLGLIAGNFDDSKKSPVSRKVFGCLREELLKKRFIATDNTKSRKNKPYVITPIGIHYFAKYKRFPDKHQNKKFLRHLKQWNNQKTKLDDATWNAIEKQFDNGETNLFLAIQDTLKSIQIEYTPNYQVVLLQHDVSININYKLYGYQNMSNFTNPIVNFYLPTKKDDKDFFSIVADHMLSVFCYKLLLFFRKNHNIFKCRKLFNDDSIVKKASELNEKLFSILKNDSIILEENKKYLTNFKNKIQK